MKRCFSFLGLVFFILVIGKAWHWAKDGFMIHRAHLKLSDTASSIPNPPIFEALDQTYHYLGRGHQCFAFESSDHRYVLKIPRHDRYLIPFWLKVCTFPFWDEKRKDLAQDKDRRLRFFLTSLKIAFEQLQEETALLYLHLGRSDCFTKQVTLIDRLGRKYSIDLNQTVYLLQEKKALMMPLLEEALKRKDQQKAQEMLEAFLDVVADRARKGILNKDPSFLRNFGYDGKVVQIDVGSFYCKDVSFAASFLQTVGHVELWLFQCDPEVALWFQKRTREISESL